MDVAPPHGCEGDLLTLLPHNLLHLAHMHQLGRSSLCRACEEGNSGIVRMLFVDFSANADIVANVGVPSVDHPPTPHPPK
jgi:hypothetical protein